MAFNALPLRPYVKPTEQLITLIAPSHCWHFDAWLLRDKGGQLYARVQTRAGGRDILSERSYIIEGGRARMCLAIPEDAQPVTLQDKSEWPHSDELNAVHSQYIMPMAARVPPGFKSRSVALHYVRCPDLPPFDGTEENWQQ